MTMTISATERAEDLREKWVREFQIHALTVLTDNAMAEYVNPTKDPLHDVALRMALGAAFVDHTTDDERVEWAHRLDKEVMTFEDFVEQRS